MSSARKALDAAPGLLAQVAQSEDGAIDQLELRTMLIQCLEAYRLLPRNSRSVAHCSQLCTQTLDLGLWAFECMCVCLHSCDWPSWRCQSCAADVSAWSCAGMRGRDEL